MIIVPEHFKYYVLFSLQWRGTFFIVKYFKITQISLKPILSETELGNCDQYLPIEHSDQLSLTSQLVTSWYN